MASASPARTDSAEGSSLSLIADSAPGGDASARRGLDKTRPLERGVGLELWGRSPIETSLRIVREAQRRSVPLEDSERVGKCRIEGIFNGPIFNEPVPLNRR